MPSASEMPGKDTDAPGAPSAPMPGMRWRRVFPGEDRQLGKLRQWLASLLPECPARDDVICVATELGTNAVQHTASGRGGWFAVEISWHGPAVRVAVADGGSPSQPQVIDDPEAEHGRGLVVVRALAARTGACGDHRGRLVWADIPWNGPDTAAPASAQDPYMASISAGEAELARLFAAVPAWFGQSILQWWALAGGELVAAPSAQELASLLGRVLDSPPPWTPARRDTACAEARITQAADLKQRPGVPAPRFPPARAPVPLSGRDGTGPGGHDGPRTPARRRWRSAGAQQTTTVGAPGLSAAAIS